jgi:hypothetical protein
MLGTGCWILGKNFKNKNMRREEQGTRKRRMIKKTGELRF